MIRVPKTVLGQLLAYAFGGGTVTLLHSAAYWLMATYLLIEPYLANSLAAIMAGLIGYVLHSKWTFGNQKQKPGDAGPFFRYVIVSVACYLVNSFWVWLVVKQMQQSVQLSIVPMILVTPWFGFVLNRYWAFGTAPSGKDKESL
jgi:putative flippase GtrA